VTRADGRVIVEEVQGNAWSRTIDMRGQFDAPRFGARTVGIVVIGLLLLPGVLRLARLSTTGDAVDTEIKSRPVSD